MRQWLIDLCESLMFQAQDASSNRALKYGDGSWQSRLAFEQEIFWHRMGYRILGIK